MIPWGSETLPKVTITMLEKLALAAHQPADSVLVQNISPSDVVSVNRAVSDALIDPNVTFMLGDYVTVIRGGVVPVQGSYGLLVHWTKFFTNNE